jgi:hypothetical protein
VGEDVELPEHRDLPEEEVGEEPGGHEGGQSEAEPAHVVAAHEVGRGVERLGQEENEGRVRPVQGYFFLTG